MPTLLIGTTDGLFAKPLDRFSNPHLLGMGGRGYGAIRSLVLPDLKDPMRIYLSTTRAGVWHSEDSGESWQEINQGLVYKEVWSLAIQPSSGDLYAGTGPASLFRSKDGGSGWEEFEDLRSIEHRSEWFLHLPPYFPHIRDVAFSQSDSSLVVCAVEEGGILLTNDAGKSWVNVYDGICPDVHTVAVMPDNSKIILVATGDGTFRSTDGGSSFERCIGIDKHYSTHVLVDHRVPQAVFAVASDNQPRHWRTSIGAGTGFFVSFDSGCSWLRLAQGVAEYLYGGAHSALWDPFDERYVFVGLSDGSIWRVNLSGSSELWQSGLPPATALAITE